MRKILTSVLSVAGLLAVVLALASSPASAAKVVVEFQTPADDTAGNAGTYTISWETQGGCDPGSGTSGASGSVTLTVAATTTGNADAGDQVETGIVTDDICNYDYKVSFVNAAGATCAVTLGTPTDNAYTIALTADGCATMSDIVVTIVGGLAVEEVLCTQEEIDDPDVTEGPCADGAADTSTVKVASERSALNDGAVAESTFTVTATPVGLTASADPNEACVGDSGDTEVKETGQPNQVTLSVVNLVPGDSRATTTPNSGSCVYDISVALPDGFEANAKGSTVAEDVNPVPNAPADGDDAAQTAAAADNASLTVKVSSRQVFLVQRVHGDAGGASATYKLAGVEDCSTGGLPGILEPSEASGGISTVGGETVVELRTGAFNISGAITGNHDSGNPMLVAALDAKGNACEASVSIKGVPAHCTVQSNSPANLATSGERVIIGFDVDCRAPEPEPEPDPEPMDDTGDMGADDMGADDMGADDMGGDDMGGDDMGDMGPPEDVATG